MQWASLQCMLVCMSLRDAFINHTKVPGSENECNAGLSHDPLSPQVQVMTVHCPNLTVNAHLLLLSTLLWVFRHRYRYIHPGPRIQRRDFNAAQNEHLFALYLCFCLPLPLPHASCRSSSERGACEKSRWCAHTSSSVYCERKMQASNSHAS